VWRFWPVGLFACRIGFDPEDHHVVTGDALRDGVGSDAPGACTVGTVQSCSMVGIGYEICECSRTFTDCRVDNQSCTGAAAGWLGCRGDGCAVCSDVPMIAAAPCYFTNHPLCMPNPTCGGMYFRCSDSCPPPTIADRCVCM